MIQSVHFVRPIPRRQRKSGQSARRKARDLPDGTAQFLIKRQNAHAGRHAIHHRVYLQARRRAEQKSGQQQKAEIAPVFVEKQGFQQKIKRRQHKGGDSDFVRRRPDLKKEAVARRADRQSRRRQRFALFGRKIEKQQAYPQKNKNAHRRRQSRNGVIHRRISVQRAHQHIRRHVRQRIQKRMVNRRRKVVPRPARQKGKARVIVVIHQIPDVFVLQARAQRAKYQRENGELRIFVFKQACKFRHVSPYNDKSAASRRFK